MAGTRQSDTRSPLKQDPLRLPGQSLSEHRSDIVDGELLPLFLAVGFAVVYAGIEWWEWLSKTPPQPVVATLIAVCVFAYAAYRFPKLRVRLRALQLGMQGEQVVGQFLDSHRGQDWHIFHDVQGSGFNVDHVIVSPKGIFAVETKTRSKPARGEAKIQYDGAKVLVNGFEPDRDAVVQARAARNWIRDLLFDTTAITYPVRGVVLFPGWFVESPKTGTRPDIWVLNEKAFIKFVENEPAVIKSEDVALATACLVNYMTK